MRAEVRNSGNEMVYFYTFICLGMATCHSLTIIDGKITGNPIDLYIFNFTNWLIHESNENKESEFTTVLPPSVLEATTDETMCNTDIDSSFETREIAILKQYTFESSLQRMSVITKEFGDDHMIVYTKGSPEMIFSLCLDDTKPDGIMDVLDKYTRTGNRVLAIASKVLAENMEWDDIKNLPRSEIECNLKFLGLIILENVLKPVSKATIDVLQQANIRAIMATGDNLLTAASVAREVNIIKPWQNTVVLQVNEDVLTYNILESCSYKISSDESLAKEDIFAKKDFSSLSYSIALTGSTYMLLKEKYPDLCPKILLSGGVFARMSPDQKAVLIEDLKEIGYGVGMCGDGANDCGALKAAHAGKL